MITVNHHTGFMNFGYYLVQPAPRPSYIGLGCKQVLTPCGCISRLHPSLQGTFWDGKGEHEEYRAELGLGKEEAAALRRDVTRLFEGRRLDHDGRFGAYGDARAIYSRYLQGVWGLRLIALGIGESYRAALAEELEGGSNLLPLPGEAFPPGRLLGHELLGWEHGGFHSYLCNSLDGELAKKHTLKANDLGLLQNAYEEVEEFARLIDGKGEPVLWLPFAVYDCAGMAENE